MTKVIALMGKAGSGKDTILRELVDRYPKSLNEIISCTSRPPREGEKDGINYHFLTAQQFEKKIDDNEMIEYTQFNGWYYGISKSSLSTDKVNVGIFNPTGVKSLMALDIKLYTYYIQATDKIRLLRQLNREMCPNVEEIIRRYSADEIDFDIEKIRDITFVGLCNNKPCDVQYCADVISGHIRKIY